jgi:hypothetical protein
MIAIKETVVQSQGLWDKLNKAVEADPNLDLGQFFFWELVNEVDTELAFCCYCSTTGVKTVCCNAMDGLTLVDESNMYAIAGYYSLDIDQIDNLEQAVGEYAEAKAGA